MHPFAFSTSDEEEFGPTLQVLRKGGRLLVMEFSPVNTPGLQQLYDAYSFNIIPALGHFVANDRESYKYLVESIRQFPTQASRHTRMRLPFSACVSTEIEMNGTPFIVVGGCSPLPL